MKWQTIYYRIYIGKGSFVTVVAATGYVFGGPACRRAVSRRAVGAMLGVADRFLARAQHGAAGNAGCNPGDGASDRADLRDRETRFYRHLALALPQYASSSAAPNVISPPYRDAIDCDDHAASGRDAWHRERADRNLQHPRGCGGGEARIPAHGARPGRVHHGRQSAQTRRQFGQRVEMLDPGEILPYPAA